jgi:perosamine synthetase
VTNVTRTPQPPLRGDRYDNAAIVIDQHPHMLGGWPVGPREIGLVNEVLQSGIIVAGPKTRRFEELMAAAHASRVAMFVNSGTAALEIAYHTLKRERGWQDGDEVLVPSITFIATITPLIRAGLKPVLVDVDPLHYDMAADDIERRITDRTRAIVPVHLLGQPCEIENVVEIARAHDLTVLEDSCETMFVRRNGQVVGSWGDMAVFSTFTVHQIATGIGGFVLTSDERLAVVAKQLANHGSGRYELSFDDDDHPIWRHDYRGIGFDDCGYSSRASDLEAALGIPQLERWPEIIGAYQRNALRVLDALADLEEHIQLPSVREGSEHAWFRVGMVIRDPDVDRDALLDHLVARGIPCQYLFPIMTQPIIQQVLGDLRPAYPSAAVITDRGFQIGCHIGLSDADMDRASEAIHEFFERR